MKHFGDQLAVAVERSGAPACVGLDPHLDRLPQALRHLSIVDAVRTFALGAIEAVADVVPSVKPQVAFYEALGAAGVTVLEEVVAAARDAGLVVVLDAKRGDIGSTAKAYAHGTLANSGPLAADSVTLSPYLGPESLAPFLPYADDGKGVFLLVRTSNPGAGPWQQSGIAEHVADWIHRHNASRLGVSGLGPIGAVIGATLPKEAAHWRQALPHAWLLLPGYGAQGARAADLADFIRPDGLGGLVVSARGVLYPSSADEPETDWQSGIRDRAIAFTDDLRAHLPTPSLPARPSP